MNKQTLTFCPKCNQETLSVEIKGGGSCTGESGTVYWFEGDAECSNEECGWKGWFSDQSE